jgi:hypothetical protein
LTIVHRWKSEHLASATLFRRTAGTPFYNPSDNDKSNPGFRPVRTQHGKAKTDKGTCEGKIVRALASFADELAIEALECSVKE